jgi:hypothetical protein
MRPDRRHLGLLLAVLAVTGCATPLVEKAKSPLLPARMSLDSVVLEMFFVRFPFGDPTVNDKLWEQIDEQQFAPAVRERLARNGFRAGLITGPMPIELSQLLQLENKPALDQHLEDTKVDDLANEPRVVRRHQQLPPGQRSEIIASGVYPQLPVLMAESGQLCGQTYNQAQGLFAVKWATRPDGRVRLEMVPELHYDQPRQRWVGDQGVWRLEAGRPKRAFADMTLTADLPPGAMLVLSSLPSRRGSLGHYFFTEEKDRLEQKLLIIRLSQTQRDGLFSPPEKAKTAE